MPRLRALLVGLAGAVLLAGCSATGGMPLPAPSSTDTAPAADADDIPVATSAPEPEWVGYVTAAGATFELPADWTAVPDMLGVVTVLDPTGAARLEYRESLPPVEGECPVTSPYETLSDEPFDVPGSTAPVRLAFRALETPAGILGSIGLTSTADGDGGSTCAVSNVVETATALGTLSFGSSVLLEADGSDPSGDGITLAFASWDEARAYPSSDEFATIVRILRSFRP